MASRRPPPAMKPMAPPSPALPERVTAVLPRSYTTAAAAPRRRTRQASLFRWRRSIRAAAANEEPRSPQVNCAGQVRAPASPDYACFCVPTSTATSKQPFEWRRLFPFHRDRRRQVSEETTTTTTAAVEDERARYLVRPPGEDSTSSPPANALVLMRCRSVDPKSKLLRAMVETSQVQDVRDHNQYGPGCWAISIGSEEEVDEGKVPAPEKKVEELK